jgi:hypothetical protein
MSDAAEIIETIRQLTNSGVVENFIETIIDVIVDKIIDKISDEETFKKIIIAGMKAEEFEAKYKHEK